MDIFAIFKLLGGIGLFLYGMSLLGASLEKLAGAGLDCVADEPVRTDNAILQAEKEVEDKLIFSPHVGGITASSFKRGYKMLWENVARIEAGERPEHIVNLW